MFTFTVQDFSALADSEKVELIDSKALIQLAPQFDNKTINHFFNAIVLDQNESTFIRREMIKSFSELVCLNQLKDRQLFSLFIDSWQDDWFKSSEVFIENQRLKELLCFYIPKSPESDDIEAVYQQGLSSNNTEILSECHYSLGIIFFQKSLLADNSNTFQECIDTSKINFQSASEVIENRIDAIIVYKVIVILEALNNKNWVDASVKIAQLANKLFQRDLFSLDEQKNDIQFTFYQLLCSLQNIYQEKPSEWLDFQSELDKLFVNYNDIVNARLQEKYQNMLHYFSEKIVDKVFRPYVISNLTAEITRIKILKKNENIDSEKYQFLQNLEKLILEGDKKKEDLLDVRKHLIDYYPSEETSINELTDECLQNPQEILKIVYSFEENSKSLLESILFACMKLQGDITYKKTGIDENARNRKIADIIEARGFTVKDQTQWSKSATGNSSGEIDIFVTEADSTPKSIIEALILNSLKEDYLTLHLNKTFTYDVTGLAENYIITYSTAKNFVGLWDKYLQFIRGYSFQYPSTSVEELDRNITDIRLAISKHKREGKEVSLYHIFINMLS